MSRYGNSSSGRESTWTRTPDLPKFPPKEATWLRFLLLFLPVGNCNWCFSLIVIVVACEFFLVVRLFVAVVISLGTALLLLFLRPWLSFFQLLLGPGSWDKEGQKYYRKVECMKHMRHPFQQVTWRRYCIYIYICMLNKKLWYATVR